MRRYWKVTFGRQKSQLLRPRKSEAEKRRRMKVWRRRLVALGMAEDKVNELGYLELRTLLKRPKKVPARPAGAKAAKRKSSAA